ncbi:hypothetical protein BU17DRAFT_69532 [Hysterangium stoloniferum]|nr:hypothetical protein BU17DRAFT_69532 [Hysterangium stoloniferum]
MLTSSFAENSNTASLLKYCYANWVLFKDHDDPRALVNRPGEGWSAWSGGEWDWMSFNKPADDTSPLLEVLNSPLLRLIQPRSHVVCIPSQTRQPHIPDPHPHPTPQPPPAPALSIWSIAHRYSMPGLIALAPKHMIEYIQSSSAFPLLLASSKWDDLHALVEDYVVDQWDMVCESEEFERCCQETATGERIFSAIDVIPNVVALLKHASYLIGSDGVSALTKLSKQGARISTPNIVMLLRDSNATVQSNGELPLVKLSEQGGHYSPCVCTMEYWHWSSFQNEVYEKRMHYIMKFSVNPKRPDTITTGGITIGIGAVT